MIIFPLICVWHDVHQQYQCGYDKFGDIFDIMHIYIYTVYIYIHSIYIYIYTCVYIYIHSIYTYMYIYTVYLYIYILQLLFDHPYSHPNHIIFQPPLNHGRFCGLPSLPNPKAPGPNNSPLTVCWPLPARCPPTVGSLGSGPRYLVKGSQYGIMWDYMDYIYIERERHVHNIYIYIHTYLYVYTLIYIYIYIWYIYTDYKLLT